MKLIDEVEKLSDEGVVWMTILPVLSTSFPFRIQMNLSIVAGPKSVVSQMKAQTNSKSVPSETVSGGALVNNISRRKCLLVAGDIGNVVLLSCVTTIDKSTTVDDDVMIDDDGVLDDDVMTSGVPKVDELLDGAAREAALLFDTKVIFDDAELNVLTVPFVLSVLEALSVEDVLEVLDAIVVLVVVFPVGTVLFDVTTAGALLVLLSSTGSLSVVAP